METKAERRKKTGEDAMGHYGKILATSGRRRGSAKCTGTKRSQDDPKNGVTGAVSISRTIKVD